MNKIANLIDAISEAYDASLYGQKWYPHGGLTFCNIVVNDVATKLGYAKFAGLLADAMVEQMKSNGEWLEVPANTAQYHANNGALVIAGGYGHVCVVRPGNMVKSTSWNMDVPKVMNVGQDVFMAKPISYAFKSSEIPKFYVLKSMV